MLASDVDHVTVLSVALSGATVAFKVVVSPSNNSIVILSRTIPLTGTGLTVTSQVAVLSPALAVIVTLPTLIALTTPLLSTVAIVASDVDHVTVLSVALSGETVAVKVILSPSNNSIVVLSRTIPLTGTGLTVTSHVAVLSPALAVIVTLPTLIAFTTPLLSTVAMLASDVDHVTVLSVALLGSTVAVKVIVSPSSSSTEVLSRTIPLTGTGITVTSHVAVLSPALAEIVTLPTLIAFTTPLLSTVAMLASDVDHATVLSVALLGSMVAFKVVVSPSSNSTFVLSRVIPDTRTGLTVTSQVAVLSPALAVIVTLPTLIALTTPLLSTVAMLASDVDHVTVLSVALLGSTVAFKVVISPSSSSTLVLSREIPLTSTGLTVTSQVAVLSPALAVILTLPTLIALTTPLLSTVAMLASDVDHVTVLSAALSGETVAFKVKLSPIIISADVLSRTIPLTGTGLIATSQAAVLSPALAVIVTLPTLIALTTPLLSTVAMLASDVDHVTVLSVALAGFTVAFNVKLSPTIISAEVLSRTIPLTGTGLTVTSQVAVLSPALAVIVTLPTLMALTTPLLSTVAIVASDVDHVTVLSVALLGSTVAFKVIVPPSNNSTEVLSRTIPLTRTGLTVTSQVAVLSPALAVIVTLPTLTAFTTPLLSTVAIVASELDHVRTLSVALLGATSALRARLSPTYMSAVDWFRVTLLTGMITRT